MSSKISCSLPCRGNVVGYDMKHNARDFLGNPTVDVRRVRLYLRHKTGVASVVRTSNYGIIDFNRVNVNGASPSSI